MDTQIQQIQQLLAEILETETAFFCVNIKIKPTNNIKVYIDGDHGVTIEKCVHINRKLYKLIEEKAWYPEGDFSLEVSSPGVDEPLKLIRQYKKNIGRGLEIILNDETKLEGKLIDATETDVTLETTEGKGKKAVMKHQIVQIVNIKKAIIQIKF